MEYGFRYAHPIVLWYLVPIIVLVALYRYKRFRPIQYRYSLTTVAHTHNFGSKHIYKAVFFGMRAVTLGLLALVLAQPQLIDFRSTMPIEGIDIILALDVSGSMKIQDHPSIPKTRFDIAKREAINFIDKRTHDSLGIVLFGMSAISRCPLTFDKAILKQCLEETELGQIDERATVLSKALVTAANRLKKSQSTSKVVILLTDGEPSPNDIDPSIALALMKELGIKVYTIGIGREVQQGFFIQGYMVQNGINKKLLQHIAQETGGQFFHAEDSSDLKEIYNAIDSLEKTKNDTPLYSKYQELYLPFLLAACAVVFLEIILSTFRWFFV